MSSTIRAPYKNLGEGGDYPIEMNYAIRIYDNLGEKIPKVGEISASLKGGQRTNHLGEVPLLDGNKNDIGVAEVIEIISACPKHMKLAHIKACGFDSVEKAVEYAKKEHSEEFERDGVLTVFYYKVKELHEPKAIN